MITEDGTRTFYAELTETYTIDQCSDFVRAWVLPILDAPDLPEVVEPKAVYARLSAKQCSARLGQWLEQVGSNIQLCSDAPSYDWHFVVELFHDQAWPKSLAHAPISCVPSAADLRIRHLRRAEELYSSRLFRRHHALDDARVNREVWMEEFRE